MVCINLTQIVFVFCLLFCLAGTGCKKSESVNLDDGSKIKVVATIFPAYDLVRAIGGEHVRVSMLVPPGVEPHAYEPKPEDMYSIAGADLFVQVHRSMEPWADRVVSGTGLKPPRVVVAAASIKLKHEEAATADVHEHRHGDPHVWLDPTRYAVMADEVGQALAGVDPARTADYKAAAAKYKEQLADLDRRFSAGLASCVGRVVPHAGHAAFTYLAERYGLTYLPLMESSSDAEPSPSRMAAMVRRIRESNGRAVFTEELVSTRLADALAVETGVRLFRLHGGHNLSKDELARGVNYIGLMEQNLRSLREGLGCTAK